DGIRDGHVTGVQTCALPICWYYYLSEFPRRGCYKKCIALASHAHPEAIGAFCTHHLRATHPKPAETGLNLNRGSWFATRSILGSEEGSVNPILVPVRTGCANQFPVPKDRYPGTPST